jgi:hypothetical protein
VRVAWASNEAAKECVYIYMYTQVCIYTHSHTHVYIGMGGAMYIHTLTHACIHRYGWRGFFDEAAKEWLELTQVSFDTYVGLF